MSLKTLMELLFPGKWKAKHLREKAIELLLCLKEKQTISISEAKALVGMKKSYYKIIRKLRSVGLIALSRNLEGKFNYTLTLNAYKFFIKKHLLEEVESVLK